MTAWEFLCEEVQNLTVLACRSYKNETKFAMKSRGRLDAECRFGATYTQTGDPDVKEVEITRPWDDWAKPSAVVIEFETHGSAADHLIVIERHFGPRFSKLAELGYLLSQLASAERGLEQAENELKEAMKL